METKTKPKAKTHLKPASRAVYQWHFLREPFGSENEQVYDTRNQLWNTIDTLQSILLLLRINKVQKAAIKKLAFYHESDDMDSWHDDEDFVAFSESQGSDFIVGESLLLQQRVATVASADIPFKPIRSRNLIDTKKPRLRFSSHILMIQLCYSHTISTLLLKDLVKILNLVWVPNYWKLFPNRMCTWNLQEKCFCGLRV